MVTTPDEFCGEPAVADVLLFTETWLRAEEEPPTLDGYDTCFWISKFKPRKRFGRPSGGVAIYVASSLMIKATAKTWRSRADDGIVWIELNIGQSRLMIACCYLPPVTSDYCPKEEAAVEWFRRLEADVVQAQSRGMVIVAGDFNCRVMEKEDYPWPPIPIPSNVETAAIGLNIDTIEATSVPRRSVDKGGGSSPNVPLLLDMCIASGMRIANGRVPGDGMAVPTSMGFNKKKEQTVTSVVDLFLLCPPAMNRVESLYVGTGERKFGALDHRDVVLKLQVEVAGLLTTDAEEETPQQLPFPTEWDLNSAPISAFVEQMEGMQHQLKRIGDSFEAAPGTQQMQKAAEALEQLFDEAMEKAGFSRQAVQQGVKHMHRSIYSDDTATERRARALRKQHRVAVKQSEWAVSRQIQRQRQRMSQAQRQRKRRQQGRQMVELFYNNPKEFHKKLRQHNSTKPAKIPPAVMREHFMKLLSKPAGEWQPRTGGSSEGQSSDIPQVPQNPFKVTDFLQAVSHINGKKAVVGGLKPSLVKAVATLIAEAVVLGYNAAVRLGQLPTAWAISHVSAIPKAGGDSNSCDGYRGIAVGTMLGKAYAWILNERLSQWAEENGMRAEGQFGFRCERGTQHAAFTLRTLAEKYIGAKRKLYTLFVDFQKAYDSVPRDLLWQKLQQIGITGWTLSAVQAIYRYVPMQIKTSQGLSEVFQATIGVKQGCPLSPLLFGLYLDDLEKELRAAGVSAGLSVLNGITVCCLLYADDLALVATSEEGIRYQTAILERYAREWRLTINVKKTKVMVFSQRRSHLTEALHVDDGVVEEVEAFDYLGVNFHATKVVGLAAAVRAALGVGAMNGLKQKLLMMKIYSPKLWLRLFDVFVEPTVLYGSEVWSTKLLSHVGTERLSSESSKVQLRFCKHYVLGVLDSTQGNAILAECGKWPLQYRQLLRTVRFYNKMVEEYSSSLVGAALRESMAMASLGQQSWIAELTLALQNIGVSVDSDDLTAIDIGLVKRKWQSKYVEELAAAPSSQLRDYLKLRGEVTRKNYDTLPLYLEKVLQRRARLVLSQLRLGTHWLRAFTGVMELTHTSVRLVVSPTNGVKVQLKRTGIPREQRRCKHCDSNEVEDVNHFLFTCPAYQDVRQRFESLFENNTQGVKEFFEKDPGVLAKFVLDCHKHFKSKLSSAR